MGFRYVRVSQAGNIWAAEMLPISTTRFSLKTWAQRVDFQTTVPWLARELHLIHSPVRTERVGVLRSDGSWPYPSARRFPGYAHLTIRLDGRPTTVRGGNLQQDAGGATRLVRGGPLVCRRPWCRSAAHHPEAATERHGRHLPDAVRGARAGRRRRRLERDGLLP